MDRPIKLSLSSDSGKPALRRQKSRPPQGGKQEGLSVTKLLAKLAEAYNAGYLSDADRAHLKSALFSNDETAIRSAAVVIADIEECMTGRVKDFRDEPVQALPAPAKGNTLYILRGYPGSGKSSLAQKLIQAGGGVIYSFTDFFVHPITGARNYRKESEPKARHWNLRRVGKALHEGVSPIIIDEPNIQRWEAKPYVEKALEADYNVKIIAANPSWSSNAEELSHRSSYGVSAADIRGMQARWEENFTVQSILRASSSPTPHKPKEHPVTWEELRTIQEDVLHDLWSLDARLAAEEKAQGLGDERLPPRRTVSLVSGVLSAIDPSGAGRSQSMREPTPADWQHVAARQSNILSSLRSMSAKLAEQEEDSPERELTQRYDKLLSNLHQLTARGAVLSGI